VQRNPMIADVFYRTGLIERWGRGTNRVAEMCRTAGIPPPIFQEIGPAAVVTFKVRVGSTAPETQPELALTRNQVGTKSALSRHQVEILRNSLEEKNLLDLMAVIGRRDRTKFRTKFINPLLDLGLLAMTVPGRPKSRLQCYRTTEKGLKALADISTEDQGKGTR